jgi:hypothetical protein
MRTASWVLLAVMGALILMGSLGSLYVAYSGARDEFGQGGPTVDDVSSWNPEIATAIRARRATAASFAAAYAVLVLAIVLGPYRRGDAWAWWALLAGALALAVLGVARIPLMGTRLGAFTGVVPLVVTVVALLLDVRRLKAPAAPAAPAI